MLTLIPLSILHQKWPKTHSELKIAPSSIRLSPRLEEILFAIKSGLGISVLPSMAWDDSKITFPPLSGIDVKISFGVTRLKHTENPPVFLLAVVLLIA